MIELLSAVSFWQEMTSPEKTVFCSYLVIIGVTLICFIAFGIVLAKLTGRKFIKSCKTIGNFCNESGDITDANLEQFEATCLNEKTDRTFLEGWESFKETRFGYPSEFVNIDGVKKKYSPKKFKLALVITSCVIFLIAVFFAIYGIIVVGAKDGTEIAPMVIELVIPIALLLSYVFVKPEKKVYAEFDQMLEDLDTAVKLQRYVNRQIDNTRLLDIEKQISDVIVAELSKPIPSKKEQFEKQKQLEEAQAAAAEATEDAEVKEEAPVEDAPEDVSVETEGYSESELDDVRDELFGDDEDLDKVRDEIFGDDEVAADAEPKKKVIPFKPFVGVLNEALDREYPKATMRKIANVLVLAFAKFEEPEQREELKNSIRKFIKSYKAAVERERAAETENNDEAQEVAADVAEVEAEPVEEAEAEKTEQENVEDTESDDNADAQVSVADETAYDEWQAPQVDD